MAGAQGCKFQEGGTHLRQGLPEAEDGVTKGKQPECLGHLPNAGSCSSFSEACRGVARRATLLARLLWAVLWLPQQKSLLTPACCQLHLLGEEIEDNNRMGKTRDLFKIIRNTKGTFHAKMGTIKDRNSIDVTEAKDNKRWQEYTELYKKILMTQTTMMV